MLYNVLPPLVFFASLGGIILIVSRVMLRLKRAQATAAIRAHSLAVAATAPSRLSDIARVIGPSHKSVHIFKNRLVYFWRWLSLAVLSFPLQMRVFRLWNRRLLQRFVLKINLLRPRLSYSRFRQRFVHWPSRVAAAVPTAKLSAASTRLKLRLTSKQPDKAAVSNQQKTVAQKLPSAPTPSHSLSSGSTLSSSRLTKLFAKEEPLSPLAKAQQAMEAGQAKRAERLLVCHLSRHPKNTAAYLLLGKIAVSRGNWPEAMEIYEQVARLQPDAVGINAALGNAAYRSGRFTKAIEFLQRARNNDPANTAVIKQLLIIAQRMDNAPLRRSLQQELSILQNKPADPR